MSRQDELQELFENIIAGVILVFVVIVAIWAATSGFLTAELVVELLDAGIGALEELTDDGPG